MARLEGAVDIAGVDAVEQLHQPPPHVALQCAHHAKVVVDEAAPRVARVHSHVSRVRISMEEAKPASKRMRGP